MGSPNRLLGTQHSQYPEQMHWHGSLKNKIKKRPAQGPVSLSGGADVVGEMLIE